MQDTLVIKVATTSYHLEFTFLLILLAIWIFIYYKKNYNISNNIAVPVTEKLKMEKVVVENKIKALHTEDIIIPKVDLSQIKDINITNEKI